MNRFVPRINPRLTPSGYTMPPPLGLETTMTSVRARREPEERKAEESLPYAALPED